jgi:SAM-dependent methyltransferase
MPTRPRRKPNRRPLPDRLMLYSPAVQHVEHDVDALNAIYRNRNGRAPRRLREDFCGTAALACEWVKRGPARQAWGVDLHAGTLRWARRHRLPGLGEAARRLTLVHGDARQITRPRVDMILALNFSYWVFKTRDTLRGYFRAARASLAPGGLLCVDAFGGSDSCRPMVESRRIRASRGPGGERIPGFRYTWEQRDFNPVDHHLRCWIHFRLDDGRQMRRAFSYDWRMWTLPELRELLTEAGFREAIVYVQDWDEQAHQDMDTYSRRRRFENQLSWLAFVVGVA